MLEYIRTAQTVVSHYDIVDGLRIFWFNYLTSESCGYSMRILFDIDQQAENLLSSFLGGQVEFNNTGWNSGEKKSVMLTREILLPLYIFCQLEIYYRVALVTDYESCNKIGVRPFIRFYDSMEDCNLELPKLREVGYNYRIYSGKNRNTHAFSGRTY